jgi:hypothetical protein
VDEREAALCRAASDQRPWADTQRGAALCVILLAVSDGRGRHLERGVGLTGRAASDSRSGRERVRG